MKSGCTLLEPYYKFRLEIPTASVGRAMSDLQARFAEFELECSDTERTVIGGRAPVSTLFDYTREVIAYTRGEGRLFCTSDGYEPCHNGEEIVAEVGYDPEADLENPPHSVFCALVDYIERFHRFHAWQRITCRTGCRQPQSQGSLSFAGITLDNA